ncbi:hypothetical protein ACP70R_016707 [Stipagrostis hirtigluma subsp. patula]
MLGASKCKVDYARKFESEQYRLKFIKNVNTIMRQHHGFGVEELVLAFGLYQMDAHHIDSWLALAATSRLERLAIDLSGVSLYCIDPETYAFPLQLLEGGRARRCILQLTSLSLKLLGDIGGFVNLRTLELKLVRVAEDDLQMLLCKYPALEKLILNSCGDFVRLQIGHHLNRLEHLSVDGGTLVESLQIDAINLRTISHGFNLREIIVREDCQIREVTADVNITPEYFGRIFYKDTLLYMFTGVPSTLPCLEKLSLNIWEDIKTMEIPKCSRRFMHLKHLNLSMRLNVNYKFDILRLVHVIEAAPLLQHFELNIGEHMLPLYDDEPIPSFPRQPHEHLKKVAFRGFLAHKDMVALALYVLNNAESLELMTVQTNNRYSHSIANMFLHAEDPRNVVNII